jgi:hypothetical protein
VVFQIGAFFHFGTFELVKLAAFLAAVKLATAVVCAVHVVERACGKLNSELLEGALLIVIALSALSCAPAVWSHNVDLLREYTMQLAMAGVGVALCMVERALSRPQEPAPVVVEEPYSPF